MARDTRFVANLRSQEDVMWYLARNFGRITVSSVKWSHACARKITRRMAAEGLLERQPYQGDMTIRYKLLEKKP